jgi:protein ImuB
MRLYACIISPDAKKDKAVLLSIAQQFSYSIEMLEDGILFDVSGLQNLVGDADKISENILAELERNSVSGSIAVAETIDAATLLARDVRTRTGSLSYNPKSKIQNPKSGGHIASPENFPQVPLGNLLIDNDTLNVFSDLGIKSIRDLRQIPRDELINRYGQQFKNILDVIEQKAGRLMTPNVKENRSGWGYQLDFPVDDFEQLIFILNHGLDNLLSQVEQCGFSTEQLDIFFKLQNKTERTYEIKTSFPTLEKTFWLKLINLRISLDPPESEIVAIRVTAHFTPPRPAQRGLYAVSRPDPEKMFLTINKLKKLVGEENVGVPVLLGQRVAQPFDLDAEAIPSGKEIQNPKSKIQNPAIAFSYFNPPIPAEVLVRDKKLIFLRTQYFSGHVAKYSGVWKANSKWWDKSWKAEEWDVEIEAGGVYRLCKIDTDWFLAGEYD